MMKNLPVVHMFQILSKIESNYSDARESHLKPKSRHTIQICSESIVGEKKGKKKTKQKKIDKLLKSNTQKKRNPFMLECIPCSSDGQVDIE